MWQLTNDSYLKFATLPEILKRPEVVGKQKSIDNKTIPEVL
jgi:hypothetical protein